MDCRHSTVGTSSREMTMNRLWQNLPRKRDCCACNDYNIATQQNTEEFMDIVSCEDRNIDSYSNMLDPISDKYTILAGLQNVIDMMRPSENIPCSFVSKFSNEEGRQACESMQTLVGPLQATRIEKALQSINIKAKTEDEELLTIFPICPKNESCCPNGEPVYPTPTTLTAVPTKLKQPTRCQCDISQCVQTTVSVPTNPEKSGIERCICPSAKNQYTQNIQTSKSTYTPTAKSKSIQTCKCKRFFKLKKLPAKPTCVSDTRSFDLSLSEPCVKFLGASSSCTGESEVSTNTSVSGATSSSSQSTETTQSSCTQSSSSSKHKVNDLTESSRGSSKTTMSSASSSKSSRKHPKKEVPQKIKRRKSAVQQRVSNTPRPLEISYSSKETAICSYDLSYEESTTSTQETRQIDETTDESVTQNSSRESIYFKQRSSQNRSTPITINLRKCSKAHYICRRCGEKNCSKSTGQQTLNDEELEKLQKICEEKASNRKLKQMYLESIEEISEESGHCDDCCKCIQACPAACYQKNNNQEILLEAKPQSCRCIQTFQERPSVSVQTSFMNSAQTNLTNYVQKRSLKSVHTTPMQCVQTCHTEYCQTSPIQSEETTASLSQTESSGDSVRRLNINQISNLDSTKSLKSPSGTSSLAGGLQTQSHKRVSINKSSTQSKFSGLKTGTRTGTSKTSVSSLAPCARLQCGVTRGEVVQVYMPKQPYSSSGEPCYTCLSGSGQLSRIPEVRYAVTRITKFPQYSTFEVLKSTTSKPNCSIPNSTESIFVLKNK